LLSLWQRNLEDALAAAGGADVKVLDRTAVILEIFAQHAQSREGQLQVLLLLIVLVLVLVLVLELDCQMPYCFSVSFRDFTPSQQR